MDGHVAPSPVTSSPSLRGAGSVGALRCCYLDLDGTLLGRGGSLLHDGQGNVSLAGVRAVEACCGRGRRSC